MTRFFPQPVRTQTNRILNPDVGAGFIPPSLVGARHAVPSFLHSDHPVGAALRGRHSDDPFVPPVSILLHDFKEGEW